jgi:4-hydroxy-tetrahydrodipicolinate synthase
MRHSELKQGLQSVGFTTPTPFGEDDGEVQLADYRENVRSLVESGATFFIPCGNTGEYYSLSDAERVRVVEATVDTVGDDGIVVAGAGGSTKAVCDLIARYDEVGADAALIMNPSHTYLHREGVTGYYRRILERTDLPLVIYKRGPTISEEVLEDVCSHEDLVGVKYAQDDVDAFSQVVRDSAADVVWINGIAERYAPTFALEGADGFTTGIGNFVPEPVLDLHAALEERDWDEALRIRDRLVDLENLRQESGANNDLAAANNVPTVKYCMELAGLTGGTVREPLVDLSEEDKRRAEEYYQSVAALSAQ